MAILAFQKPENVIMMEASDSFAKFELRPLEPGYGITIGNALRRILLSSLEGYAITSIRIEGVNHEFATIPGVLEDVTNIILNLKQVRFKPLSSDAVSESIQLTVAGKKVFTAGEMNKKLTGFEVLNPDLVICHLDEEHSITIEINIDKGRGYVPADEKLQAEAKAGEGEMLQTIAIDSIYTPIRNVKYWAENFRVEQKTDYEKLILEITTDGSIHPQDALKESARILIEHFRLFSDETIEEEVVEQDANDDFDPDLLHMRQLLKSPLQELDLSVRALNCLNAAQVFTLGELVGYEKADLMKFRNFGKKSLDELQELLDKLNLTFGMDISKYKLDKD
ncbi:DNA-directed RNA polymerase subunit alpha [Porphyromonas sp. COT-239 OH1446]|uniref:DNA-directed RNA polymerase subunit alpha n=1 Tax=Porphyromonas sp. COT-239 OH1446 TaxID=1515613 RepID=UPI00052D2240|nr:DNA-directed RNA polymerase subunit alpha [Porphyromonas sp. COT-239 OH1446]KGN70219.1 DNA-directed RNA polymerase subunit alpha [Porphyromonas sp. COT-239 OH1446]